MFVNTILQAALGLVVLVAVSHLVKGQLPDICTPSMDGLYGTESTDIEFVEFAYSLHTVNTTTDAQAESIIVLLEREIATVLIQDLVDECEPSEERRKLQQNVNLTGLSPRPDDVRLVDRACLLTPVANRCDLVRGALTIFVSMPGQQRRLQQSWFQRALDSIERSMTSGDLNNVDPNVVEVEFVPLESFDTLPTTSTKAPTTVPTTTMPTESSTTIPPTMETKPTTMPSMTPTAEASSTKTVSSIRAAMVAAMAATLFVCF